MMNTGLPTDRARSLLRAALDPWITFNPQLIHLRITDRCSGNPDHFKFNCHDGGLTVPLIAGATELVSTLVNWGHLTFWLAPDGSLVALEKAKITGYVLFIPFYDWHEVYRRWLRVDTPEPNSVAPESDPLKTRQLAEEGDVAAQYSLAYMLEFGADQRVPLDYFEAYKWFTIVAARESTPPGTRAAAVLGRDFVASKIDAQQTAEAEQRARDWTAAFEKRQQAQ